MSTPGQPLPVQNDPALVPLGEWYNRGFKIRATCTCGRVAFLHTGNLIREYGYQKHINARELTGLAERCRCNRCKRKEPRLEIVVSKD